MQNQPHRSLSSLTYKIVSIASEASLLQLRGREWTKSKSPGFRSEDSDDEEGPPRTGSDE